MRERFMLERSLINRSNLNVVGRSGSADVRVVVAVHVHTVFRGKPENSFMDRLDVSHKAWLIGGDEVA